MRITNLFSKRQKKRRGEVPDVFIYDAVPSPLRVQVVHIVRDALGTQDNYGATKLHEAYEAVHDVLAREYGVFQLAKGEDKAHSLINFFLGTEDHEKALDVIEVFFRAINTFVRDYGYRSRVDGIKIDPDAAIAELNARFLEHGVGYRFESGELVRIDSEFLHAEAVKPALALIQDKTYTGVNVEFLKAHEHYRHARYEETLTECLKAFESTLKSICHKRKWSYAQTDIAKTLLETVFKEGLIPGYLQSEFNALRATLESGVPTIRNKQGGHGRGVQTRNVPPYLAGYMLNLTASSIVFLIESEKALP